MLADELKLPFQLCDVMLDAHKPEEHMHETHHGHRTTTSPEHGVSRHEEVHKAGRGISFTWRGGNFNVDLIQHFRLFITGLSPF